MSYIKTGTREIKFKSGQDIKYYRNMLNTMYKDGWVNVHTHTDVNPDGSKVERKALVSNKESQHRIYTVKLTKDNELAQDFYLLEVQNKGGYEAK
jgi:hypothetical protein